MIKFFFIYGTGKVIWHFLTSIFPGQIIDNAADFFLTYPFKAPTRQKSKI